MQLITIAPPVIAPLPTFKLVAVKLSGARIPPFTSSVTVGKSVLIPTNPGPLEWVQMGAEWGGWGVPPNF